MTLWTEKPKNTAPVARACTLETMADKQKKAARKEMSKIKAMADSL